MAKNPSRYPPSLSYQSSHTCLYAKGHERVVVLLNVKETQVIVPITSGRVVEACVYTHKYLGGKADPPSL